MDSSKGCVMDSWTLLMYACRYGTDSLVKTLFSYTNTLDHRNDRGWTALMFAASNGHRECLRALVNRGANLDYQNKEGRTALMLSARRGHLECVRILLNHGANLDRVTHTARTALMYAGFNHRIACVRELLENGATIGSCEIGLLRIARIHGELLRRVWKTRFETGFVSTNPMVRTLLRTRVFEEELMQRVWHPKSTMTRFFTTIDDDC